MEIRQRSSRTEAIHGPFPRYCHDSHVNRSVNLASKQHRDWQTSTTPRLLRTSPTSDKTCQRVLSTARTPPKFRISHTIPDSRNHKIRGWKAASEVKRAWADDQLIHPLHLGPFEHCVGKVGNLPKTCQGLISSTSSHDHSFATRARHPDIQRGPSCHSRMLGPSPGSDLLA